MTVIDTTWARKAPPRLLSAAPPRQTTSFQLIYGALSAQLANGGGADASRLALRTARSPRTMLRWLRTLDRLCVETGVKAAPFDLARKPSQSFLHNALPQGARIHLLTEHYARMSAVLAPRMVGQLLRGALITLPAIEGKSGALYRLTLGRSQQNRREGELHIKLVRDEGALALASLALVVGAPAAGQPIDLWIGGLQGCTDADSKAATVQATKDLSGLRPKDLLIHITYALATLLCAERIKGVANAGHVHRCPKGERSWSADYDTFWGELGGAPIAGGFFLLPSARDRRTEVEVAPAKRKAWRARYALIDAVCGDIARLEGGKVFLAGGAQYGHEKRTTA